MMIWKDKKTKVAFKTGLYNWLADKGSAECGWICLILAFLGAV